MHSNQEKTAQTLSTMAFAHHKLVKDTSGNVIDYIFLDVNDAFTQFTGLQKVDVLNQPITKVLPSIKKDPFDWISFYGELVKNGGSRELIQYSQLLDTDYKILAFSTSPDTFTTVFTTLKKEEATYKKNMDLFLKTAQTIFNAQNDEIDIEAVCHHIADHLSAACLCYFTYDAHSDRFHHEHSVPECKASCAFSDAFYTNGQEGFKNKPFKDTLMQQPMTRIESKNAFIEQFNPQHPEKIEMEKEFETIVLGIKSGQTLYGFFTASIEKNTSIDHYILSLYTEQLGLFLKQKETEKLRISERERFENILTGADVGTWEWHAEENVIVFNKRFAEMLGYDLDEISPMDLDEWMTYTHPQDTEKIYKKLNLILDKSIEHYNIECRKQKKDGSYLWVHDNGRVIKWTKDGKPILMSGTFKDVHERKIAEDNLKESERSKAILLSNLPGFSYRCLYDKDWTMFYISEVCESVTGYAPDDFINNKTIAYNDIIHPKDQKRIFDLWEKAIKKQTRIQLEYRIKTRNNEEKWVWEQGEPILDDNNQVIALEGFIMDITSKKKVEDRLKLEASRFDTFVNVSLTGAWEYHADRGYLWCSAPYFEMLGRNPKDYDLSGNPNLDDTLTNLLHPDDREKANQKFKDYLEQGSPGIYDNYFRLQHSEGHYVWIWSRGSCVRDESGKPSELVMGTHIDISRIKALEAKLSEEKKLIETTLISVGDGVISTDAEGRIVLLNKVGESLTGYTQEEAVGQPFENIFKTINEHSRKPVPSIVKQVLKHQMMIEMPKNTILISQDNIERPVEDSAAPIFNDKGRISGVVVIFRDFTEKKKEQEKILNLSYHDQLTGLYNRRFYEEELKRLDVKRNLPISLVIIDVNGLKMLNDSFGHQAGDRLLEKTAAIIKKTCRGDDITARYGGDEFIILLPKTTKDNAEKIVRRIVETAANTAIENISISLAYGINTKHKQDEKMSVIFKITEDSMYQNKLYNRSGQASKTIDLIMQSLYAKSPREMAHAKRVSEISKTLATHLKFTDREINLIGLAGLFHDIGKIGVSERILNKPDTLTSDEWVTVKRHPEIGWRILSAVPDFQDIATYVLQHHERYDGTGYPRQLKGDNIALEARILALADAYDTMTNTWPYRKKLSKAETIKELKRYAGTQFDPDLTNRLIKHINTISSQ